MSKLVLKYYLNEEAKAKGVKFNTPRELDAGYDLPCAEDVSIEPGGFALISTGLHFQLPAHWLGLVKDRSSVALRGGVTSAGVIDAGYRGEVKVAMHNLAKESLEFKTGERVAQMIVIPHFPCSQTVEVDFAEDLDDTERASGGFGSTGV
ncbi:hypothetical protein BVY02_01430 [bacterium J17]|nr:hypothetical protein BVY02_01430 [bacterium J17]